MTTAIPTRTRLAMFILPLLLFGGSVVSAGEAPRVEELRTQKVGDTTYFQVRFATPAGLQPEPRSPFPALGEFARIPSLVPQDKNSRCVYPTPLTHWRQVQPPRPPGGGAVVQEQPRLEFFGKLTGNGQAKFLLLYPSEKEIARPRTKEGATRSPRQLAWNEATVTLNFDTAKAVAVPESAGQRTPNQPPGTDDLEGLWAMGQATFFALMEAQTPEFGFYPFAREATNRKYSVQAPSFGPAFFRRHEVGQLYETTTGAAAVAESLQMQRLLNPNARDNEPRTVDITKVQGIDIAEHPWTQMMAGKKPTPEPLAKLVPNDNYYVHFKNIRKFIEFGELLDQWGTNLTRAYETKSRDYLIKERYEKQICIKSTWLGKTLGPAVIRGLALTGSDCYLREGSDLTVVFHVKSPKLFLAAVQPFIEEARKEFAGRLKEEKAELSGITVESFVTPRREVSLHRAVIDEFVVYSNSPAGLQRIIDTFQGRHKALADSLDFQYMRTVFRLEDEKEDGFAFLSDPFIRQLVGPASKIKEKRRLEALTSLYMLNYAALFTGWENGKPAADQQGVFMGAGLKLEMFYAPEGKPAAWDREQQTAVSEIYNTIQFATPIIELAIDKITPAEERGYQQFRAQYLGLWRGYFDPIGMRVSLNDRQVRLDTYILPLIQNSEYNQLRQRTGDGTMKLDVASFAPETLIQFVSHISPNAPERQQLAGLMGQIGVLGRAKALDWLGDWFFIRLDDSSIYSQLGKYLREEFGYEDETPGHDYQEATRLWFQVPVTLGVAIHNPLIFTGVLTALRGAAMAAVPDGLEWEPMEPKYKGVSIVRIRPTPNSELLRSFGETPKGKEPFSPAAYYMLLDGAWYISLQESCLKGLIDRSVAKREAKEPKGKAEVVEVNNSLYLAPGAAVKAKDFLRALLEWESHRQALANTPVIYALCRAGLVDEKTPSRTMQELAMKYLGFVPVSPEGAGYTYDPMRGEVVNQRHGSRRLPKSMQELRRTHR
jgi:hypothetical protein